jgi:hypothetical protein
MQVHGMQRTHILCWTSFFSLFFGSRGIVNKKFESKKKFETKKKKKIKKKKKK